MLVRHCVEASNVDENSLIVDPLKIRHVTVKARKIDDMSSFIDPATHLNLDFAIHKIDLCIISEKLEKGAKVRFSDQGFLFAVVPKTAFRHFGSVDYTKRLLDMKDAVRKSRDARK
jgi:hypothetical protein